MKIQLVCVTAMLAGILALPSAQAGESSPLLDGYFAISQALASDNLDAAKSSAEKLAQTSQAAGNQDVAGHAAHLAATPSIEQARKAFKALSADAIRLAQGQPGFYVMTCGMAKADWLQNTKELANPYMGKAMLKCGHLKR